MLNIRKMNPVLRAIGVIGSVAALVTGVTFAVLTSTATLTNSTISTTTADLKVWDGAVFNTTAPGFTVTNLVPGTGQTFPFYLKNGGGVNLNVSASVPTLPSSSGFTGWENVVVTIVGNSPTCVGSSTVITNLLALNAGDIALPCNALTAGAQGNSGVLATEGNYQITFDINPAAISGSQATVDAFSIELNGTQAL